MKHRALIALIFIVGCATGGVAAQLVVPPVRAGTSPTRWEYQCTTAATDNEATVLLNRLGAEGWELVTMAPAHADNNAGLRYKVDSYTACAKRALP